MHEAADIRDRIQVGDLVNHHGFLGIVTRKEALGFAFETLQDGKPNGESFFFYYSFWKSAPEPKTCWRTE
jgi:hypothetical protein